MGKVQVRRRSDAASARRSALASGPKAAITPTELASARVLRVVTLLRGSAALVYGRGFGLSQIEWRVVALVGEHAPLSLNALADFMGLDKGQTSRAVSALVA